MAQDAGYSHISSCGRIWRGATAAFAKKWSLEEAATLYP